MAQLKHGATPNTTATGTSGSSGYNFPSSSFTHQKQPHIPSDQKAKLLAMHRDGKANAGIYVAVVLIVYFILVIILVCRYGRRRRTPDPNAGLDGTVEQGRLQLINSHIAKIASCGGDDCFSSLNSFCFGTSRREDANPGTAKSSVHPTHTGNNEEKESGTGKSASVGIGLHKQNNQGNTQADKDNGIEKCHNSEVSENLQKNTPQQDEDRQTGEDSEESLEDD